MESKTPQFLWVKDGETIRFGKGVSIKVFVKGPTQTKMLVDAPKDVSITRAELFDQAEEEVTASKPTKGGKGNG